MAGICVSAVFWGSALCGLGWFLSGPVAIGIAALFITMDTSRRAQPVYLRPAWLTGMYAAVMVLVIAGVIVGAVGFAFWVGRR